MDNRLMMKSASILHYTYMSVKETTSILTNNRPLLLYACLLLAYG